VVERESLFEHPLLSSSSRRLESEDGDSTPRRALLLESDDWVNVIPLVEHRGTTHLVLIRQWRLARGTM
jgi:hypothetical protein